MCEEGCDEPAEESSTDLAAQFRDPVDIIGDGLARRLGLQRDPELSLTVWRSRRVEFIQTFPDDLLDRLLDEIVAEEDSL